MKSTIIRVAKFILGVGITAALIFISSCKTNTGILDVKHVKGEWILIGVSR